MEVINNTININDVDKLKTLEKEKANFYARQYYHRKRSTDQEFTKYTNDRQRIYAQKKAQKKALEEIDMPKKKLGRPPKIKESKPEPKKRGCKVKYDINSYKLNVVNEKLDV